MKVDNLIEDLRDGVKLLALLEVLSGERLPMERGRVLRRPHYLSNINTALEFLRGKRVSLAGRLEYFLAVRSLETIMDADCLDLSPSE